MAALDPRAKTRQGKAPEDEVDIHKVPEHWKGEKHKPIGAAVDHLEIDEAVIARRRVLQSDCVDSQVQLTVGASVGAQLLEIKITRLQGCRLFSLGMDKWGKLTGYDGASGNALDPETCPGGAAA